MESMKFALFWLIEFCEAQVQSTGQLETKTEVLIQFLLLMALSFSRPILI